MDKLIETRPPILRFTIDVGGEPNNWRIAVMSFATGEVTVVQEGGTSPSYAPSVHLVVDGQVGL